MNRDWIKDYKLTPQQLSIIKETSLMAEKIFKLFKWEWDDGLPSALKIEKELIHMAEYIIEDHFKYPTHFCFSGGRLVVTISETDEEGKRIGLEYDIEISSDEELKTRFPTDDPKSRNNWEDLR